MLCNCVLWSIHVMEKYEIFQFWSPAPRTQFSISRPLPSASVCWSSNSRCNWNDFCHSVSVSFLFNNLSGYLFLRIQCAQACAGYQSITKSDRLIKDDIDFASVFNLHSEQKRGENSDLSKRLRKRILIVWCLMGLRKAYVMNLKHLRIYIWGIVRSK